MKRLLIIGAVCALLCPSAFGQILAPILFGAAPLTGPLCSTGGSFAVCPPPTNLQLWLSADCITLSAGVCTGLVNGTTYTTWTWNDRSGNARNGSQVAGSFVYRTNQINGQPALDCNTASRACATLLTSSIPLSSAQTVFAVFALQNTALEQAITTGAGGGVNFIYRFSDPGFGGPRHLQACANDSAAFLGYGTALTDTSWHQSNVVFTNASGPVFRLDRASDATISGATATPNHPTTEVLDDGGSLVYVGYIAEILIYNVALSGTDVTTVESYLHTKYGL